MRVGTHVVLDMNGIQFNRLEDIDFAKRVSELAALNSGAMLIKFDYHKFEPQGLTTFCILAESHISTHSYPEYGILSVDMYTCGECDPVLGTNTFIEEYSPTNYVINIIERKIG